MPPTLIKSDPRAREKPCIRCGYSLRKVTDSLHCPECGLAVWLSLNQNDTLDNSNPDWLRRTAFACWILAAACLVWLVASLPQMKFAWDFMRYRQEWTRVLRQVDPSPATTQRFAWLALNPPPRPNATGLRVAYFVALAAFAGLLAGLFLLTTREGRYPDKLTTYRVFARVLCAAGLVGALATLIRLTADPSPPPPLPGLSLSRVTFLLALTCAATYLRELARRAPSQRLARLAGWLALVPMASLFYSFIRKADWLPDLIPLLLLPASAALFITFALLLKRDAMIADKNWRTETAPT